MIKSIKTILFTTAKMRLYATVSLLDTRNQEPSWYSIYRGNFGSFLTFTPTASLTMKYLKERLPGDSDGWSRQEQIYLTHKTIGGFKLDVEQFYRRFQRTSLFEYDENNIPISVNKGNRDIVVCSFESGQVCTFEPAILSQDGSFTPGVILRINMKAYEVPMTVWEFESFYDIVRNIQLYDIGMNMIQLYLSMNMNRDMPNQPPPKIKTHSASILFEQVEEKKEEELTTNTPLYKPPTTLEELGGLS